MTSTPRIFALIAAASCTFVAAQALADAGTPKERAHYRAYLDTVSFACPAGTTRVLETVPKGNAESCITADNVRQGYYLLWNAAGTRWLELGYYDHGHRVGRWVRWSVDGTSSSTVYGTRRTER